MKQVIFIFFALIFGLQAQAQLEEKMKKYNVVKGVIYKDGKSIEGYMRKTGVDVSKSSDFVVQTPWDFQREIYFIPKEKFDKSEKIRRKYFTRYKPSKCDGYKYNDSLTYTTVKYADLSGGVGLGMLARKTFLKKVMDGKISLYLHYPKPQTVEELQAETVVLVFRKANAKNAKPVVGMSVKKIMADCPTVAEKFANDEYKAEDFKFATKFGTKLIAREKTRLLAIFDYNKTCK